MAFDKLRDTLLASASEAALGAPAPSTKRTTVPDKSKTPPPKKFRFARLDAKPLSRPRGRHAVARSDLSDDADDGPQIITIPTHQRLGFRVAEFAALIGVSNVTVWRGIKAKKIKVIDMNGVKIIPRRYAVDAGYISQDDAGLKEQPK
jgi:hypothetical protein